MSLTISQFTTDVAKFSHEDVLIRMLLEQQEEDGNVDFQRKQATDISTQLAADSERNSNRMQMKEIGQKLNKLERSFMRDRDLNTSKQFHGQSVQRASINNKYDELSAINFDINQIFRNISHSGKPKPALDNIRKKLIVMYNQSVQELSVKDKLTKKIQGLKERQAVCEKQINEVNGDIENYNGQLEQVKALRGLNARKWQKIEENFTKLY